MLSWWGRGTRGRCGTISPMNEWMDARVQGWAEVCLLREALALGPATWRCDLGHIPAPIPGPEPCVSGAGRTCKEGQCARRAGGWTDRGSFADRPRARTTGRPCRTAAGPQPRPPAVFTLPPCRPRGFWPRPPGGAPPSAARASRPPASRPAQALSLGPAPPVRRPCHRPRPSHTGPAPGAQAHPSGPAPSALAPP